MDLVPYAVPFFLAAILLEFAWGYWRGRNTYRLNDSINSLSLGGLSVATKLLGLNLAGPAFDFVGAELALFRLDPAAVPTWLFALLAYDFCYYWFHRISHERTLFWAAHVVHHQSEEFNLSTALRQTSTGFLLAWVFYLPCFLLGVPAEVFITIASAHLIYQFWVHSRHIPKLGFLEWFLVTASNHRVHHARNPAGAAPAIRRYVAHLACRARVCRCLPARGSGSGAASRRSSRVGPRFGGLMQGQPAFESLFHGMEFVS